MATHAIIIVFSMFISLIIFSQNFQPGFSIANVQKRLFKNMYMYIYICIYNVIGIVMCLVYISFFLKQHMTFRKEMDVDTVLDWTPPEVSVYSNIT